MKYKITMLCNEKQFKAIKPKLEGKVEFSMLSEFNNRQKFYLINHLGKNLSVTNVTSPREEKEVARHEKWNEQIFLEACGIETERAYSLTKEQLRSLTDPKIKEWFPEVFKPVLEVGKIYKGESSTGIWMFCFNGKYDKKGYPCGWGFTTDKIFKDNSNSWGMSETEATESEVFEGLKNEAVKRGFVNGAYYKWINCPLRSVFGNDFVFEGGVFRINGFSIMDSDGKWADIIQTITKSEAEKQLNKKIID